MLELGNGFTFNSVRKDYVLTIAKKRQYWAPVKRSYLTIPGRPGAFLDSTETDIRTIEIDVMVSAESADDLRKVAEDFADWLITDDPAELIFDDEPDRIYYAVVDGTFSPDEIVMHGSGTITFICPDPYKYGPEETVEPNTETVSTNFVGKIAGSVVENGHTIEYTAASTLSSPSSFSAEGTQGYYDAVKTLDGSLFSAGTTTSGTMRQVLFSFDIFKTLTDKYGADIWQGKTAAADKLVLAKTYITGWTLNWYGYGSSPSGNKVSLSVWSPGSSTWGTTKTHSNGTVTNLNIPSTSDNFFDANGFIYFNANAEASDGVTGSYVRTDYISLDLQVIIPSIPLVFENLGSVETLPVITTTLNKDVTFVAISDGDKINMVGRTADVDQATVVREERKLWHQMDTLTGWSDTTSVEGGVITGTMKTSGYTFFTDTYGSNAGWHGPAKKISIGSSVQDFQVDALVHQSGAKGQSGSLEIALLDASNNFVAKMLLSKRSASSPANWARFRAGSATNGRDIMNTRGATDTTWANFDGMLRISRVGNQWTAYACLIDEKGVQHTRAGETWVDSTNIAAAPITQVQVQLWQYGTTPTTTQNIGDIKVYKINSVADTQVPVIASAGDVIEFDHQNDIIRKNGEDLTKEKAFIGEYFALDKGMNTIVVEPSDAIDNTEVRWRPKWR